MERQSSRIYFQGKYHKDIYFQGHFHKAAYLTDSEENATLVWEKLKTEEGVEFIPWGINYCNGLYFVLENSPDTKESRCTINLYTGKTLTALKLRFSEKFGINARNYYLYFLDYDEYGFQYAFGSHPQYINTGGAIGETTSYYRRVPDYNEEITDIPGRIIQCKNFGVVFDAEGNFYYCYTANARTNRQVKFYKGRKRGFPETDFLGNTPYVTPELFANYLLPKLSDDYNYVQSAAFLVKDRIAVCCTPIDSSSYSAEEVVKKPFYLCSVSVSGDGSDITHKDLGSKELAYSNSDSLYVPIRLSTTANENRISMITDKTGTVYTNGSTMCLIINFVDFKITGVLSRSNPLKRITYAYKFNKIYFLMLREYYSSGGELGFYLYYGNEISERTLKKLNVIVDDNYAFLTQPQLYYAACSYIKDGMLFSFSSDPVGTAGRKPLQINLKTGNYEEIEIITKQQG